MAVVSEANVRRRQHLTPPSSEWRGIYDSERNALFSYLRGAVHDDATAEDLVQDIFVSLLGAGDPPPPPYRKAWLYTVARNKVTDHYRRRSRQPARPFSGTEALLEDQRQDGEKTGWLELLGSLAPDTQEIIYLHLHGDMTFTEIAEVVGRSQGTVATWYRRGLETLRQQWQSERT